MPFVAWARPADEVLARRAFGRYRAAPTKQRARLKNQRHAWQQSKATPPAILEAVRAYATLGEITTVMKDVFGIYEEPTWI